jgi:tight adherence protein B
MALLIAAAVFVALVLVIVGLWWARLPGEVVRQRLTGSAEPAGSGAAITKPLRRGRASRILSRLRLYERASHLIEQAGYRGAVGEVLAVAAGFGVVGALLGALRLGGVLWPLATGALTASLPFFYLSYRRSQRVRRFQQQFPDALDMMTRAVRAGHALSSAVRVVGDEMPAPIGEEFQAVAEEIRLGVDLSEALARLERRIPIEDVQFFCSAIRIQRGSGGNLAEILDRLAEVIRERFKLLSHARILSAQHRWTAICVGTSPIVFAIGLELLQPGYFAPLMESPVAPMLLGAGLAFEVVGFFVVWRIAKIKV